MLDEFIQQTTLSRDKWYDLIDAKVKLWGLPSPDKPTLTIVNWPLRGKGYTAGEYWRKPNRIMLNLSTLFLKSWDNTIGHEMVHAFQFRIMSDSHSHGELFDLLMRVCGVQTGIINVQTVWDHPTEFKTMLRGLPRIIHEEGPTAASALVAPGDIRGVDHPDIAVT